MSFVDRLFHRNKAQAFDAQQIPITTNRPPAVEDTRHYLANSLYQLPKDEEENTRLDFQHHALFHALGNHYVAPIHPPLPLILDVGTGTGIWAQEMARWFPQATVIGIDLAATSFKQPTPANCLLRTGNVLTGLPFPDALFSYTHQRLLVAGIPAARWPGVVHELVRVTQEQGWLELIEIDHEMQHAGPATARVQALLQEISASMGFGWEIIRHLGDLLQQEGVTTRRDATHTGPGRRLGRARGSDDETGFVGCHPRVTGTVLYPGQDQWVRIRPDGAGNGPGMGSLSPLVYVLRRVWEASAAMMDTLPQTRLTRSQVAQLLGYCATYRSYLWQCVPSTPERNQAIRCIQMMQGRLEKTPERGREEMMTCTKEEQYLIRQLLSGLTRAYGNAPPSEHRAQQLGELAAFRRQIEHPFRQTRTLSAMSDHQLR